MDAISANVTPSTTTPSAAASAASEPDEADRLRVLVLLRHAQAADHSPEGDIGRELTDAGRAAARELGEWLAGQGVRPDVVLTSPATRTRQTWEGLRRGGLRTASLWADRALYEADAQDVIESVRCVDDAAGTVLVVAHAPAIPQVARSLPDHREHPDEGENPGWPPAGCAVVSHRGPWSTFPSADSAVVALRLHP